MLGIPEEYKKIKRIAIKDFIPKTLKPATKKKIRESIKKVSLIYQIEGESMPSVLDEVYNYQIVQFYDFEISDMKRMSFVAKTYQEIIKAPCVLRLYDAGHEAYSFALKRLNRNDSSEIVVTDSFITESFQTILPDPKRESFLKIISYPEILNRTDKVSFYLEMYVKAYIMQHEKAYSGAGAFLSTSIWYSSDRVRNLHGLLKSSVEYREKLKKAVTGAEKMELNKRIKEVISELDKLNDM